MNLSNERLEEIKGRHTGDFGITDSDIDYLIEQNKRYRESIEKVLYETGDKVIQNILETALESGSNESKRTSNRMGK